MSELILLRHRQIENLDQLDVYRENEGFEAFKKVVHHAAGRSHRGS
jgi:hypothetical protein